MTMLQYTFYFGGEILKGIWSEVGESLQKSLHNIEYLLFL